MLEMPPVGEQTIREIMDRRAREEPAHVYCYFKDRAYTFGEIDDAVNRVANGLLALGLVKGDRVALMLPSHPDHVVAIFALAKIGLVRVPVNVHLKGAAQGQTVTLCQGPVPEGWVAPGRFTDATRCGGSLSGPFDNLMTVSKL